MTETAKERIYRGALETMSDSDFMGNKYVKKFVKGVFKQIEDAPVTTDKLLVEKLQEQLNNLAEENNKLRNALEDIRTNTPIQELLNLPYGCACHEIANDALAAIGGDDEL